MIIFNDVFLTGNTGYVDTSDSKKDASKKHVYFSVCQTKKWVDRVSNEKKELKFFHDCKFFDAPFWFYDSDNPLEKGDFIVVKGELNYWEGEDKKAFIVVKSCQFKKKGGSTYIKPNTQNN